MLSTIDRPLERDEWVRAVRLKTLDTDVLHARFVSHRFARHTHPEFVIAYVESGVEEHYFRGQTINVPAQHVVVVNPDEPHLGAGADDNGFTYKVLYPPVETIQSIGRAMRHAGQSSAAYFREPVCSDPEVVCAQHAVHAAIASQAPALELEALFIAATELLLNRLGQGRFELNSENTSRNSARSVHRARDLIIDCFREEMSLAQLADECNMSMYHLQRIFLRSWGISPHELQSQLRVFRAREMLRNGWDLKTIAADVGFFDQSHLNRHFKRVLGITPGEYKRAVQNSL